MRWLLLLTLISCGKHDYPAAQDFRDFDGDMLLNEEEKSLGTNEHISDLAEIPPLQGKLLVSSDSNRGDYLALEVSNTMDSRELQKIATARNTLLEDLEIVDDWSRLWIIAGKNFPVQDKQEYRLKFSFPAHERLPPLSVTFIHEGKEVLSKPWSALVNFTLSSLEMKSIASGKSYFRLDKSSGNSLSKIKEKTYQVLYHDGSRSKVLHVSKGFDFQKVLEFLDIKKSADIDEEDLLLSPDIDQQTWWYRNLNNGNKLIISASLKSLKEWHLKGYKTSNLQLKRLDGVASSNGLSLTKHFNSKVLLKIRSSKVLKDFRSIRDKGYDDVCIMICACFRREVFNERPEIVGEEELTQNLFLMIDGERVNPYKDKRISALYKTDQDGQFLELYLTSPAQSVQLGLSNKDAATYDWTGIALERCGLARLNQTIKTMLHPETSFSLNIEAKVEELGETI